jgi:hypothetical protein
MSVVLKIVIPKHETHLTIAKPVDFIKEFNIKAINIKEDPEAPAGWTWIGDVSTSYFSREMMASLYNITTHPDCFYYRWNISLHFPSILIPKGMNL